MRQEHSLDAVNFFLADVRQGLGPYLAIYLLTERHWAEDQSGFFMTIAAALSTSLAGLVVVHAGFSAAFLVLAGIAASGFLFYFLGMPETQGTDSTVPGAIAE